MRLRSRSVLAALSASMVAAVVGGCEDETPSAPLDAGGPNDTITLPDGAASDSGPRGANDAGADATDSGTDATDAQTRSNNAPWSAADGLPSTACAAWTLTDTSTARDPVIAAGVMTVATDAVAENMYWSQSGADLITPAVLVVEARLRVVSGSSTNASRAPAAIVVRYGTPLRVAPFYIGSGEAFLNTADLAKGPTASVTTTDGPHTYRIAIDTTTHAITITQDGAQILTGTAYVEASSGTPAILFGEASILATGSSEWSNVTHNAHALSPCP